MSDDNKSKRTPPGGLREGEWLRAPDGAQIRACVRRGFDCRERCEHEPSQPNEGGQNHGQAGDSWFFDYREGDVGAVLKCISYVRDGAIDASWKERREWRGQGFQERGQGPGDEALTNHLELPIIGAYLHLHKKASSGAESEECPIFGRCEITFMGYLYSAEFFQKAHCDALLPHALRPVDEIDLRAVTDAMSALWAKMAVLVRTSSPIDE